MLPERISFDPVSFLKITRKQNKEILEFILAEFQVYIPLPSANSYLMTKALLKGDVEKEVKTLKEVFNVVEVSNQLMVKMAELGGAFVKEGIVPNFSDLMTAASAILTESLLVASDKKVKRYEMFSKYGLDVISYSKFLEEIESLVEEEARKVARSPL
ncbi:type II toxin-antitoxin system VapC family toxin [Thermococcus sp.]|uniref:type II toxin-antitoxin system VapC family toxin n=1 Tax=Thermococcus sp. TaxID=35749 RepID=UPI00261FB24A|nr:type II toxin-antitoxin system VapC family toxin [Thermococcus sp.]